MLGESLLFLLAPCLAELMILSFSEAEVRGQRPIGNRVERVAAAEATLGAGVYSWHGQEHILTKVGRKSQGNRLGDIS